MHDKMLCVVQLDSATVHVILCMTSPQCSSLQAVHQHKFLSTVSDVHTLMRFDQVDVLLYNLGTMLQP